MDKNRIKVIRDDLGGISQAKLAAKTGIPLHKIRYAETSKANISREIAQILSENLGYSFSWILTGEGPMKKGKSQHQVIPVQPDFPADDFVFIRQVNGKISAGGGLMPDNSADLQCAFRRDWIKKRGGKPDNMSLIKVSGDSMAPTLLSGDLVLVDHSRTTVTPQGGIYAISIDHEIMIKRIQVLFPQNKLRILSDNSHYDPIEADPDQVKINGRVIWYGREI
jgi:phage repressor protein C with HTH and peptisase S24 domain